MKRQVTPVLERDAIPCITGFIGFNKQGYTTTLGRGGTDYTATIIAHNLAEIYPERRVKVILWKNVDVLGQALDIKLASFLISLGMTIVVSLLVQDQNEKRET